MADEKAVGSGFMFKHGEKVAVGVAGAALLGYAVWAYVVQGPDESIGDSNQAVATMEEKSDRYQLEKSKYDQIASERNIETEWKTLDRAEPIKAWAGNFRPRFEITEEAGAAPVVETKITWVVPDVTLTNPVVDLTGVSMDVEVSKVEQITTGTNRRLEAPPTGWELQRKTLSGTPTDWATLPKSAYKIASETIVENTSTPELEAATKESEKADKEFEKAKSTLEDNQKKAAAKAKTAEEKKTDDARKEAEKAAAEVQKAQQELAVKQGEAAAKKTAMLAAQKAAGSTSRQVFRFKDSSIDPKTRYAYRLRATGESTEKPVKTYDGRFCSEKEVRTRGDFRWEIKSILVLPDGRPQIGVYIYKFDRVTNKELFLSLNQFEGDTIGVLFDENEIPPKKTTKHKAKDPKTLKPATDNDGKPLPPVDFDTKARITKVESVKKDITRRVCDRKFNPDGTSECAGVQVKTQPYAGNHVIITDDEGVAADWWKPEYPDLKDDVCEKHAKPPEEAPK